MSKTKRDLIKRKLAQCLLSLEKSINSMIELHLVFDDDEHTAHATLLQTIIEGHALLITLIKEFWIHTYGKPPDNLDSYR